MNGPHTPYYDGIIDDDGENYDPAGVAHYRALEERIAADRARTFTPGHSYWFD